MSGVLTLRNRQRAKNIDRRHLCLIVRALLTDDLLRDDFEIGVFLVNRPAMTKLNEQYLGHKGCTDVITFDYCDAASPAWVGGDIFVCVPEALQQARRFRTTWQSELVRYIVHGILHLLDYDDRDAHSRCRMKREEDRLVNQLRRKFNFARLGGHILENTPGGSLQTVAPGTRQHD